ncbi:MAG: prepilin-type N-terminal cleavage/methylation domain-containing protein [Myxococcales bacterium]|nr:prepilin-type N-terminal cleavage/methylation domain-containing protein [Myxococcales bacterium]
MSRAAQPRGRRGFTLLEVMIAMAILAFALTALLGHEGVAIQMSDYSNRMSQASLLAQGKFLEVEQLLLSDGMDRLDGCEGGDFRAEGFKRYRWKACGYKLEMSEEATTQLTEELTVALGGFGLDENQLGKVTGQATMMVQMVPTMVQSMEDQVRKVRLEVTWKDALGDRQVVLERFVTAIGADSTKELTE